jgi:hypothetical protein
LKAISKELYLKYGWKLPEGHIDKKQRNPLNFTRKQWQQAKRLNEDPKLIKQRLKECWAISDSKKALSGALEQQGFYLAKGDRRGFVAVDWRGEVYSLSRWLDIKSKNLKERMASLKNVLLLMELNPILIKHYPTKSINSAKKSSLNIIENAQYYRKAKKKKLQH